MFPEITRDEVFRIETQRLWLRWPMLADAADIAALLAQKHQAAGSLGTIILTEDIAAQAIRRWRDETASGRALTLAVATKAGNRQACGIVRLTSSVANGVAIFDYGLTIGWRGKGLMTEAAQAVLDAGFMLGQMREVTAAPPVANGAGRAVLERCGFTFVGTGLDRNGLGPGLSACDRFSLDRKTWRSLKGWRKPDFASALPVPCATEGCA